MNTISDLIKFATVLKSDTVNPDNHLDDIIQHLEYLATEKMHSKTSYLVEIPQHEFELWNEYRKFFFLADTDRLTPAQEKKWPVPVKTHAPARVNVKLLNLASS